MLRLALVPLVTLVVGAMILGQAMPPHPARAAFPGANGKIAFISARDVYGRPQVYAMNPDGTDQMRLTDLAEDAHVPAWSPDGRKIAYVSGRDRGDGTTEDLIYVFDVNSRRETQLTATVGAYSPAWSPDGERIVYEGRGASLRVTNSDGTGDRLLVDLVGFVEKPAWSPDGATIAFTWSAPDTDHSQVYLVDIDGTNLRNISNHASYNGAPDWSPDGSQIVFIRDESQTTSTEIFVMQSDGTGQRKVTGGDNHPSWSPDGSKLAFQENGEVFLVNPDGTGLTQLTDMARGSIEPTWQPLSPEAFLGDIDCTGSTDSKDAARILQLVAGLGAGDTCVNDGDANDDSRTDAVDATVLLQFEAGLLVVLPP